MPFDPGAEVIQERVVDHARRGAFLVYQPEGDGGEWVTMGEVSRSCGRWADVFSDPLSSPAHYTRTIAIYSQGLLLTAAGADGGRGIRAFHKNVHSRVSCYSLVPFHGLSPTVRSLHLKFSRAQPSEIVSLMCSFPILQDFILFFDGRAIAVDLIDGLLF